MERLRETSKAIAAGVVAGLTYLVGVVSADDTLAEAFGNMRAVQWFGLGLAVLGSYGIVYAVPNKNFRYLGRHRGQNGSNPPG